MVVIFDEDRDDRYQYLTTWLGEHQNESDMAFYSTFPFDNIVGPGIGRAEYGGILMTLPPRRLFDVWSDADYDFAESKAERLLMAALDYSVERFVVYVAAKPPAVDLPLHRRARWTARSCTSPSARFRRRNSRGCAWSTCSIATSAGRKPKNISGRLPRPAWADYGSSRRFIIRS